MNPFTGTMLFAAVMLSALPLRGDARVLAEVGATENIRAAHIEDDGSGVLVIGSAGGTSTLAFFDAKLSVSRSPVPGVTLGDRIHRVGAPREGRFVATAVGDAEAFSYVVLERAANKVRVIWNSSNLQMGRGAEPYVSISPDGRMWAAVAVTGNRRLTVQLGQLPEYKPFLTTDSTMTSGPGAGGSDNPTVTWIDSDRKQPLVAVQWLSVVNLYGSENGKPVRATLSAYPATGMRWQPSAGTLWVDQRGTWLGYSAAELKRAARTRTAGTASRRMDRAATGMRILELEPLADGAVAVVAPPDAAGNGTITIYDFVSQRPVKRTETVIPRLRWAVSPSARRLITIPAATPAKVAYVRRIL